MRRSSVFVALAALGQLSCGGSQPGGPTSSPVQPLSISGVVTLGEVHPSVQLALTSGGADVTNSATWQSSNPSVAIVSFGLVRATGLGTSTISAAYKGQTESSVISVVPDQDCIPYDPSNVSTITDRSDPTVQDITAPVPGGGLAILAPANNPADALNLVALFRRYSQACYVGRNNPQFRITYFKSSSGQQTTIAPEDCVPYSAGALQVVNQGGGSALVSGGTQLALLENSFEAALANAVASQASNECFIGRGNTRPKPYLFTTEYWK